MSTLVHILRRLAPGRFCLVALLALAPIACTGNTDDTSSASGARLEPIEYHDGPIELTLHIDTNELSVGTPLTLQLDARADSGSSVHSPLLEIGEDGRLGPFHVLENNPQPDYPGEDGRRTWSQRLVLDTFEAGTHDLPAITVRYKDERGDITMDGRLVTDAIPIVVTSASSSKANASTGTPAQAEAPDGQLRDIKGTVDMPIWQWLLLLTIAGLILLLAAVVIGWLWWLRRRNEKTEPPVPAHVLARQRLDALEAEGLLEQREFQPFYFRLSDILRHYIEDRFGLLAPRKTTPEFLTDLRTCAIFEQDQQHTLSHFMRFSDMVKFALHEPPVQDGREAMAMARSFVHDTEPVPEMMEDDD